MARFKLIPEHDPSQAHRIQRFLIAVSSSVLVWILMYVLASQGHLDMTAVIYIGIVMLVLFALFYALFRSGINLRAKDPSLTAAQMLCSIALVTVAMFFASNEARGVLSIVFVMSFFFGIFRLGIWEMMEIAIITFIFYLLLVGMLVSYRPEAIDLRLELLRCAVTITVLVWVAAMAGYLARLRKQLSVGKTHLEHALQTIQEMTTTDPLTGVSSRHFLLGVLQREQVRSARANSVFCVCIMDIDRFKTINDGLGHYTGDEILRGIADIARRSLRAGDFLGRYGGDEFMLILADTTAAGARSPIERLCLQVSEGTFSNLGSPLKVTVSIGVAEYHAGEDAAYTVHRAEVALNMAKAGGRNRVEFADAPAAE